MLLTLKVGPATWNSYSQAFDVWDEEHHTRGLLLGSLCLNTGWIRAAEDLLVVPGPAAGRRAAPSKSQLPLLMSRAQACALMRTIENPLRRREALNVIADRLDAGAQQFANELTELTWPDDIRTLCGDPSILK